MSDDQKYVKLSGTQEILFRENDQLCARISALGQAHIQGAHFMVEHAQTVSRLGLGMALLQSGLAVLVTCNAVTQEQAYDIENLCRDMVEQNDPPREDALPF